MSTPTSGVSTITRVTPSVDALRSLHEAHVRAIPFENVDVVLDTCAYIDLDVIDAVALPAIPEITAVTLAELHQGVAMARDTATRAARTEKLGAAVADFDSLPFDGAAAARYGTLVALAIAAGRYPRPRRMDLMIAAIASAKDLPLYTRNADDFKGLDPVVTVVAV